jgi:transcriptional regulator with XRE-family HTH domain
MNTTKLAHLRMRTGLSQSQVAQRMGVTRVQVSRIEAMYPNVMFTSLRSYMDAIGADVHFTADGIFDVVSGDVEEDTSRTYAQARRKDPTRRAAPVQQS